MLEGEALLRPKKSSAKNYMDGWQRFTTSNRLGSSAPVNEGLLLVCGIELGDEVLEVSNGLLPRSHLLLALITDVREEHATLCSTTSHKYSPQLWSSASARVSEAIAAAPVLLQLLTVIRHGDLGMVNDSRVIPKLSGTGMAPCRSALVLVP